MVDQTRTFSVVLEPGDEGGFTVRVPALPEIRHLRQGRGRSPGHGRGCHSARSRGHDRTGRADPANPRSPHQGGYSHPRSMTARLPSLRPREVIRVGHAARAGYRVNGGLMAAMGVPCCGRGSGCCRVCLNGVTRARIVTRGSILLRKKAGPSFFASRPARLNLAAIAALRDPDGHRPSLASLLSPCRARPGAR